MRKIVKKESWGEDHWVTFAYISMCVVKQMGMVEDKKMRTSRTLKNARWPNRKNPYDASLIPTRLYDGTEISAHDDWSCAEDMIEAGFLKDLGVDDSGHVRFGLTEEGWKLWFRLQRHIAGNIAGNIQWYKTFSPEWR